MRTNTTTGCIGVRFVTNEFIDFHFGGMDKYLEYKKCGNDKPSFLDKLDAKPQTSDYLKCLPDPAHVTGQSLKLDPTMSASASVKPGSPLIPIFTAGEVTGGAAGESTGAAGTGSSAGK